MWADAVAHVDERHMQQPKNSTFGDRATASAEAKKAMLAKFQAKPTVNAPEQIDRSARRAAELEAVRVQRATEREAARVAREAAEAEAKRVAVEQELAALDAKRGVRKERKTMERSEAQARRAARLAAFMR